jgi:hypothetical protein
MMPIYDPRYKMQKGLKYFNQNRETKVPKLILVFADSGEISVGKSSDGVKEKFQS